MVDCCRYFARLFSCKVAGCNAVQNFLSLLQRTAMWPGADRLMWVLLTLC